MFVLYFLAVILYNEGNAFSFRKQGGQNPSPHQGVRILLRKIGRALWTDLYYIRMGDQPQAIEALTKGFEEGNQFETLVGVTGSGKTFTMANIIQNVQKPTLIISHNKTLAAQLYGEMKEFFPENAVEYFVS